MKFDATSDEALTLSQQDGCWRFDQASVARISELFHRLSTEQKIVLERPTPFHSPRQTMRTLLVAVKRGNKGAAAECLDLSTIPYTGTRNWGQGWPSS